MTEISTPLLDKIHSPKDLRNLPVEELPNVCQEVRSYLVDSVSKTAGHLASGLAVVELTTALHYVTPLTTKSFGMLVISHILIRS